MRLLSWLKGLSIPKIGEYKCEFCGKKFYRDEIDSHICMEKAEAMRKRLVELVSDDVRGIRSDFTVFRRNDEKAWDNCF